jgi:hypothetical protein
VAKQGNTGEKFRSNFAGLHLACSQGSFTCRKSTTWDRRLYFPSEGRRATDFITLKIHRPRPGLNPRPWVQWASTLTTTPPRATKGLKYRILNKNLSDWHGNWKRDQEDNTNSFLNSVTCGCPYMRHTGVGGRVFARPALISQVLEVKTDHLHVTRLIVLHLHLSPFVQLSSHPSCSIGGVWWRALIQDDSKVPVHTHDLGGARDGCVTWPSPKPLSSFNQLNLVVNLVHICVFTGARDF